MALGAVKTWAVGDILTAADLNTLNTNILNNAISLISPLTANVAAGSFKLTGLGAGSATGDSVRFEQLLGLGSIGTARQVPTVNAGATALAFQAPITLATEQASTSGTAINFTGIPAGAKRVTVMFAGVSGNGTSQLNIRLGTSGGVEATGYVGAAAGKLLSTGFAMDNNGASTTINSGILTLNLQVASTNTWVASGVFSRSEAGQSNPTSGYKSLSGVLDRVQVTYENGTDAFDAGMINISYE